MQITAHVLMQALAHAIGESISPHCLCGASTTTDMRLSEAVQCCRGRHVIQLAPVQVADDSST